MLNLFITGATGFIGSHVLAAALTTGYHVRALRRSRHASPVVALPREPEWCTNTLASLSTAELEGCGALIHLSGAGVSPKHASWSELVDTNVTNSLRLLEKASTAGIRRFVVAGSCHEYGRAALRYNTIPPDAPLEPVNAYGASKAASFQLLRGFAIENRLELFYGRIFTCYGEGQYWGNFWPSLRRAAIAGEDFPMTSGRQISDFIPVASVAAHLLAACSRPDISPGHPLIVNIGSGIPMRLLAFAEGEWNRMSASGRLLPGTLSDRHDQIDRYVPDLHGLTPTPVGP